MKRNRMFYMKLFWFTFQLSAFTFGGGYVIVPMMKKQFVDKLGWLEERKCLILRRLHSPHPERSQSMRPFCSDITGRDSRRVVDGFAAVLPPLIFLSVIAVGYKAFIGNEIVEMSSPACRRASAPS